MFAQFDVDVILRSLPFLWQGMQVSLLLGGAGRHRARHDLRRPLPPLAPCSPLAGSAGLYVNMFRSVPLILVIFWFYFLVPVALGRPVGGFTSALIAFVLFEAAYYCEIIRAGVHDSASSTCRRPSTTSYPCWVLSRTRLLDLLSQARWRVMAEFDGLDGAFATPRDLRFTFCGLIAEHPQEATS